MGLAVLGTNAFYYNMILLQLTNMKMEWGDFTKLGACEPVIYDQLLKLRSFFLLYIYIYIYILHPVNLTAQDWWYPKK